MKEYLAKLFEEASLKADYKKYKNIQFTVPQEISHGDYSTNIAMLLAKELRKKPREIASEIIEILDADSNVLSDVSIAGPGFINFTFNNDYVSQFVKSINDQGVNYGRSHDFEGKKANVEFVSANPTGPLTVGHGRNAVLGDTVARFLEAVGYNVDREYYFNNAGRQMRVLGDSVAARYSEIL